MTEEDADEALTLLITALNVTEAPRGPIIDLTVPGSLSAVDFLYGLNRRQVVTCLSCTSESVTNDGGNFTWYLALPEASNGRHSLSTLFHSSLQKEVLSDELGEPVYDCLTCKGKKVSHKANSAPLCTAPFASGPRAFFSDDAWPTFDSNKEYGFGVN